MTTPSRARPMGERRVRSAYRAMSKAERRELDCFYGGFSCALAAALYGESGTHTSYREAMGTIDVHEFYLWARRNHDVEVPRIRHYLRDQAERERMEAAIESRRASTPTERPT